MAGVVCEQCRESVSEQARNCPHCGYDAGGKHKKYARNRFVIGLVCMLTIVGTPIGLIFFWMSYRSDKKAKNATVGVPA